MTRVGRPSRHPVAKLSSMSSSTREGCTLVRCASGSACRRGRWDVTSRPFATLVSWCGRGGARRAYTGQPRQRFLASWWATSQPTIESAVRPQ